MSPRCAIFSLLFYPFEQLTTQFYIYILGFHPATSPFFDAMFVVTLVVLALITRTSAGRPKYHSTYITTTFVTFNYSERSPGVSHHGGCPGKYKIF